MYLHGLSTRVTCNIDTFCLCVSLWVSEGQARGKQKDLGQEYNDRPSALRDLRDTIRDKNKMSHKRKPNLHKVRKCPYVCVWCLQIERVWLLCVNRWILHQRGVNISRDKPPPCAESECKQKSRYHDHIPAYFLAFCCAVMQSTTDAFHVLYS